MRVAVIGAGYAGLAAAESLRRAGTEVVVLEGLDRVGGRVWSDRLSNGGLIERGAEFVTRGYETMERYAAELGLELQGMGIRYPERRVVPDPCLDRGAVLAAVEAVETAARAEPSRPAVDLLGEVVVDADVRELLASRLQSSHGYPVTEFEAAFLVDLTALVDDHETRRIAGGNQQLALRLAERLGDAVHLNEPARRIAQRDDAVTVATETGEIAADACVVAVPAPAVGRIELDPSLPSAMASAYSALRISTAAKLAAPLAEPATPDAVMSAAGRWWCYTTPSDGVGGRVVAAWAGSAPVVDLVGARDGPDRWLDLVEEIRPELRSERAAATVTLWDESGWVPGGYSVQPHAWDGERGPFEGPVGRIAFAGEHTARDWVATMEGALRSGERSARDVLEIAGSA
jgi:monoamine oxidase